MYAYCNGCKLITEIVVVWYLRLNVSQAWDTALAEKWRRTEPKPLFCDGLELQ